MRKIYLLRGAPGCGKSTFIRNHRLQTYTMSTDELRLLFGALKTSYDPTLKRVRQTIPQDYNSDVFSLLNQFVTAKMKRGETIIIDATHLFPNAFAPYEQLVKRYGYELILVDFTHSVPLTELLRRNELRMNFRWVPPDIISTMYQFGVDHQKVPHWVKLITPEQFDDSLLTVEETRHEHHLLLLRRADQFPETLASDTLYLNMTGQPANRNFRHSGHWIDLIRRPKQCADRRFLPFYAFYWHHHHYLASWSALPANLIRISVQDDDRFAYRFGLLNTLDFVTDFPGRFSRKVTQIHHRTPTKGIEYTPFNHERRSPHDTNR